MFGRQAKGEPCRRGLELQAALPQPSRWAAERIRRRDRRADGADVAWSVADVPGLGWAALLAVPGVTIWLLRRLRGRR